MNSVCPMCGGVDWSFLREGRDLYRPEYAKIFRLDRCLSCGHVTQQPQPDIDEISQAYLIEYAPYRPAWKHSGWPLWKVLRELTTLRRMHRLKQYARGSKLLEVGSGAGDFLYRASCAGWCVKGVEYSAPLAGKLRLDLDIDVRAGELTDDLWEKESFDVVVLWSVLEHVPVPIDLLRIASSYLRAGGTLLIQIPTSDGLELGRSWGGDWALLDLPRHINFFDKASLTELCGRAGMSLTCYRTPLLDSAWCYFASVGNFAVRHPTSFQRRFRLAVSLVVTLLISPYVVYRSLRNAGTEAFAVAVKG